jgi:type IV secretory pathway component VirB8
LIFSRAKAWEVAQWLHIGADSTHPVVEYGEERSIRVVVHKYDFPNPGIDIVAPAIIVLHKRTDVESITHTKWRLRI